MDDLQNKGDGARREVRPLASSYAAPLVGEINGLLIPGWYFPSLILSGLSVQHNIRVQTAMSKSSLLPAYSFFGRPNICQLEEARGLSAGYTSLIFV